jgi:plasmid replication initiation protein
MWLFEAVTKDRDILSISPKYFDLTSGLDRFLYRLARRHLGRQAGWIFTFRALHTRSGSAQPYGQFARDLRKALARNALPEYSMNEIEGANGPSLAFNRDPAKIEWRQDRRYKM